jgi:hypothetical protein
MIRDLRAERIQKAVECISGEAQGQAVDVSDEGAVATFFKANCDSEGLMESHTKKGVVTWRTG